MKIFRKGKETFITVEINGKAYDYPKDMPLPRMGELVQMGDSPFGRVTRVLHQICDKEFRMISISTEAV